MSVPRICSLYTTRRPPSGSAKTCTSVSLVSANEISSAWYTEPSGLQSTRRSDWAVVTLVQSATTYSAEVVAIAASVTGTKSPSGNDAANPTLTVGTAGSTTWVGS